MKIMYSVLELKFHLSPADKVNNMISNLIGRESTIDSAEIVFIQFVLSHVISSRLIYTISSNHRGLALSIQPPS